MNQFILGDDTDLIFCISCIQLSTTTHKNTESFSTFITSSSNMKLFFSKKKKKQMNKK